MSKFFHTARLAVIAVVIIVAADAIHVSAWTAPSAAPTGGNVDAPINVGGVGQSKSGGLVLNTSGAPNGLLVQKGNVGIGITSPTAKLHVNANAATTPLVVRGGGGSGVEIIRIYNSSNTEVMRIANNGAVGINDTTPDGTLKLDVGGKVGATQYCDASGLNCKAITAMGGTVLPTCTEGQVLMYKSGSWACGTVSSGTSGTWVAVSPIGPYESGPTANSVCILNAYYSGLAMDGDPNCRLGSTYSQISAATLVKNTCDAVRCVQ